MPTYLTYLVIISKLAYLTAKNNYFANYFFSSRIQKRRVEVLEITRNPFQNLFGRDPIGVTRSAEQLLGSFLGSRTASKNIVFILCFQKIVSQRYSLCLLYISLFSVVMYEFVMIDFSKLSSTFRPKIFWCWNTAFSHLNENPP